MALFKSINNYLKKIFGDKEYKKLFLNLFLINLVSALSVTIWNKGLTSFCLIFLLSSFITCVEHIVCCLLPHKLFKPVYYLLIVISSILLCIDWSCRFLFQQVICQTVIDIFSETDWLEIRGFCITYFYELVLALFLVIILNISFIYLSKILKKWSGIIVFIVASAFGGMAYFVYAGTNLVLYGDGMGMPQLTTPTRLLHSIYVSNKRTDLNLQVLDKCVKVKAYKKNSPTEKSPNIIVVIGESFSRFHSSLYDYHLNTNPLLLKRKDKGEIVVFDDAISVSDHTHSVMESVFSLTEYGQEFSSQPLFPACFKAAGFYTALYDNQYEMGSDKTFLNNEEISKCIFHDRNTKLYKYDEELIDSIKFKVNNSLIVIHLIGQHYFYKDRYPQSFEVFTEDEYDDKFTASQREIIASYDNATLYNDYIIDKIIKEVESTNTVLVYFSDHGEEVFECRNYMGHGNAAHSPNLDYQIQVPLLVWMSDEYKKTYQNKVDAIKRASSYPIITDDISHFLLDLSDIETMYLDETRSFINDKYNKDKNRIVLHSIKYEK